MKAYILVKTEPSSEMGVDEVQRRVLETQLEGLKVLAADIVTGTYDLIVTVETELPEHIGSLVIHTIRAMEIVNETEILVRLR